MTDPTPPLEEFFQKLAAAQIDLPESAAKLLRDHAWELYGEAPATPPRPAWSEQFTTALLDAWLCSSPLNRAENGTPDSVYFSVRRAVDVVAPIVEAELSRRQQEIDRLQQRVDALESAMNIEDVIAALQEAGIQ